MFKRKPDFVISLWFRAQSEADARALTDEGIRALRAERQEFKGGRGRYARADNESERHLRFKGDAAGARRAFEALVIAALQADGIEPRRCRLAGTDGTHLDGTPREVSGVIEEDDDTGAPILADLEEALAARDRAYYDYVNAVGGFASLAALVQEHALSKHGEELTDDEALYFIEGWRQWGVARNLSLGEYLDLAFSGQAESD